MKLQKINLSKKKKFILVIILGLLLIIANTFFNKKQELIFLTEKVKKGDINQSVIANGTVRSNNRVEVGAQVNGEIKKLNVFLGQKVKKGDLIATIDSKTQVDELKKSKSKLNSYKAQFESGKINLEVANSKFIRSKKLYKLNSISQNDYESAKQAYYESNSKLKEIEELIKQSEIEVETAKTNLSYTKILSPMDGVIISIPISEGQTVNSSQTAPTIVQIADLNRMLIKPEISEGDITKIKIGQKVKFTILSAPDKKYKGEISSVDPGTTTLTDNEYKESASNTSAIYYYANIVVDNPDNILRIGMTTTNIITVSQAKNVLIIPFEALHEKKGKYVVKVLNSDEKVIEKEVKIGIKDESNIEIKDGLKVGEKVIVSQMNEGEVVAPQIF